MRAKGGAGVLLSGQTKTPVLYDLVEASGERGVFAEGQVFGDARALHAVFDAGPCILHMEGGRPVHVYLADSRSSAGVAEIRVTEPLAW